MKYPAKKYDIPKDMVNPHAEEVQEGFMEHLGTVNTQGRQKRENSGDCSQITPNTL